MNVELIGQNTAFHQNVTSDSGILVAPGILPEANSSSVLTSTMTGSLAWTAAVTSSNPQDMVLYDIKIQIETGGFKGYEFIKSLI